MEALHQIAERTKLHLSSDGVGYHLLSEKPISPTMFKMMVRNGRSAKLIRKALRRKLGKTSLLMDDFRAVTGWDV
jgi:hypothetical protein